MDKYPVTKICPYCAGKVILTTNDYVYGRNYGEKGNYNCYACIECKASVGTHPDKVTPLGRLADRKLKALKIQCHDLFDWLWKSGVMRRFHAYAELAKRLGIPGNECHFGWFDEDMLLKAQGILLNWRREIAAEQTCRTCLHRKKSKRRKSWICGNKDHKSFGKQTAHNHTCESWRSKGGTDSAIKKITTN